MGPTGDSPPRKVWQFRRMRDVVVCVVVFFGMSDERAKSLGEWWPATVSGLMSGLGGFFAIAAGLWQAVGLPGVDGPISVPTEMWFTLGVIGLLYGSFDGFHNTRMQRDKVQSKLDRTRDRMRESWSKDLDSFCKHAGKLWDGVRQAYDDAPDEIPLVDCKNWCSWELVHETHEKGDVPRKTDKVMERVVDRIYGQKSDVVNLSKFGKARSGAAKVVRKWAKALTSDDDRWLAYFLFSEFWTDHEPTLKLLRKVENAHRIRDFGETIAEWDDPQLAIRDAIEGLMRSASDTEAGLHPLDESGDPEK